MRGTLHVLIRDANGVEHHRATHDVDNVNDATNWVRELAPADDAAPPAKKKRSHSKKAPAGQESEEFPPE